MKRHMPQEVLPTGDYIDTDGDIRHPDDDPAGFAAEGLSPRGNYFRGDAMPHEDTYYDELAEADEFPVVAVDLGHRARHLLRATNLLSKASMLEGLLNSNNPAKIAQYGGRSHIIKRINKASTEGRAELHTAAGYDIMLEHPYMVPDEDGVPYSDVQAKDEMTSTLYRFRQMYTADGYRSFSSDKSAADKARLAKEIDQRRDAFRHTLAQQAISHSNNKTQS